MNAHDACRLIETVCFKPGWKITSTVNERFEHCVKVTVNYPARLSNKPQAPDYRISIEEGLTVDRNIMVGPLSAPLDLYRELLMWFALIDLHEDREFFRVGPSYEAPFHPHTVSGMNAWGDVLGDLFFGVAS